MMIQLTETMKSLMQMLSSIIHLQRCIQSASLRPGTHSFFFWTQRILNEGSNWTQKKKSRMFMQITKSRKKQRHTMRKFVFRENIFYQLVDSSVTVYFAVNFQNKAEKPLCFLITPQSRVLSFVCYVWISTCCVTLSELFFGGTNRRHCRSANNNLPFQSILSFFACCPSEFQALVRLW